MNKGITIFVLFFSLILIICIWKTLSSITFLNCMIFQRLSYPNGRRRLVNKLPIKETFTDPVTFSSFMRSQRLSYPDGIMKINTSDNSEYINKSKLLADKFRIKEQITDIPDLNISKILGVYENCGKIDFNMLPSKFVIKVNHWSGDTLIVDKAKIKNWDELKKTISKRFDTKLSNYYSSQEYHYMFIKPVLFIEEYLNIPDVEYKLHIIHGKVVFIFAVVIDSNKGNMYSIDWKELDINYANKNTKYKFEKPKQLKRLISIAEYSTRKFNIDYTRLDLYIINDMIYFGEFTMTNLGLINVDFTPISFDKLLLKFLFSKTVNYNEINKYLSTN